MSQTNQYHITYSRLPRTPEECLSDLIELEKYKKQAAELGYEDVNLDSLSNMLNLDEGHIIDQCVVFDVAGKDVYRIFAETVLSECADAKLVEVYELAPDSRVDVEGVTLTCYRIVNHQMMAD